MLDANETMTITLSRRRPRVDDGWSIGWRFGLDCSRSEPSAISSQPTLDAAPDLHIIVLVLPPVHTLNLALDQLGHHPAQLV